MIRAATANDWSAIERLLTEANLPLAGASDHLGGFVVAERDGDVVACAALERYGASALLRSVAVDASLRGTGIGERLVHQLINNAKNDGLEALLLLTTTASEWFPRFGFTRIARESVPAALQESEELRGACPSTAVVMSFNVSS